MTSQPSGQEALTWEPFIFNGQVYDLSHLNAHWIEYQDNREGRESNFYKFKVTYGLHCFTKENLNLSEAESPLWIYKTEASTEARHFNIDRYNLSKQLPSIIRSLGEKETLVFFAGFGRYATSKVIDFEGIKIDYFIVFDVFRAKKSLRLHVRSAYPMDERMGKVKKVSFFVIAFNLLKNKPLPKPPK